MAEKKTELGGRGTGPDETPEVKIGDRNPIPPPKPMEERYPKIRAEDASYRAVYDKFITLAQQELDALEDTPNPRQKNLRSHLKFLIRSCTHQRNEIDPGTGDAGADTITKQAA